MVASKKVAFRTPQAAKKRSPSSHPIRSGFVCLSSRPSSPIWAPDQRLYAPPAGFVVCGPATFCLLPESPELDDEEGGKEARPFFSSISSSFPARVGEEGLSA